MLHNARSIAWICLIVLSFLLPPVEAVATKQQTPRTVATTTTTTTPKTVGYSATCLSQPVNYITHTHLSQCLDTTLPTPKNTASDHPEANSDLASDSVSTTLINLEISSLSSISVEVSIVSQYTSTPTLVVEQPTLSSISNPEVDTETDSPLDNAKFLSFEEWKSQNLALAGQSAETLGQGRRADPGAVRQRPGGTITDTLDALGDDSEIELDFSGFGGGSALGSRPSQDSRVGDGRPHNSDAKREEGKVEVATTNQQHIRSKDAGKTCKERFNYASFDCAANVIKTNAKCKSSSSILVENKDSYMLNECSMENKFLIVELCDDILIDTVVLANFEFFSSMFRAFRISVSDRYPIKLEKWKELGTFEARNSREIQAFLVENPLIWARYLRVEFLTHYGSEYYCPLSLLRVHGTTMIDEFRHQEALARGDIDPDDDEIDESVVHVTVQTAEMLTSKEFDLSNTASWGISPQEPEAKRTFDVQDDAMTIESKAAPQGAEHTATSAGLGKRPSTSALQLHEPTTHPICEVDPAIRQNGHTTVTISQVEVVDHRGRVAAATVLQSTSAFSTKSTSSKTSSTPKPNPPVQKALKSSSVLTGNQSKSTLSLSTSNGSENSSKGNNNSSSSIASGSNAGSSTKKGATAKPLSSGQSVSTMSASSPTPQPPATQESFFKSIHKRLQFLESNSTLSLQYIESQSALLRDAFAKVEKRQLSKTSAFLESLNSTVLGELARFRAEYEQLWQSTVLELASQREDGRLEAAVLGDRVRVLAEEMVSQKRLMAAQATLLLLCLGLVVFGRLSGAGNGSGLDVSFVQGWQGAVAKRGTSGAGKRTPGANERSGRWSQWESPWASPPRSPQLTRPGTSHDGHLSEQEGETVEQDGNAGVSHLRTSSGEEIPYGNYAHQRHASGLRFEMQGDDEKELAQELAGLKITRETRSAPATPTPLSSSAPSVDETEQDVTRM